MPPRWLDKEDVIYTIKYYSAIKKKEKIAICNNLDIPEEDYTK